MAEGEGSINPLFIVIVAFILVAIVGFAAFMLHYVLNALPNPFPAGSAGNAIYGNDIIGQSLYASSFSTIDYGLAFALMIALVIYDARCYFNPNKGMGIVNILLVFLLPFLWYILAVVIAPSLAFLNAGTGIPSILYNLYISPYFIVMIELMLIIGTIFCFRHTEETGYGGQGKASPEGMASPVLAGGQDMSQYKTLGGEL